ncbi:DNA topoisomerase IV subunit A [Clostridium pasteurianum]|uniref:DNA topoisomerase IV subunit A n=1 Tax=Clostridium pasteurianum TaxID=1501 RepID=UPI00226086C2|nr:DNA topoisomerase IV subunit A [Clostridium pasteurianum]UZW15971.1 DNA topoisomerase IV subunit A [Clostridium pasteurianum]
MARKIDIPKDNNIINVPIEEAMPDNYLPYAVEVARDRALPDVRDGLKPVHRRILYGAYMMKAFPDKPYYKSARIVGDILGKYHPHGDTSVYDAMVILAQNFTTRYPLIDGHGNWGSQDGDNAAAMRYTEARLTPNALEMLRDMDKDVVNMVENYSASELEPEVLPARYPNLLVNGAFGIAVGLATNIPPHNLKEVIDATLLYIDNNEVTTKELMEHIKGPDLPTGGIIIGKESMLSAYESGEGKVTLRAKTSIEQLENGRYGIVITEFPYRRNKAKLLQSISEMTGDKKHQKVLEGIVDIRDESDRSGIRAVIEFKKSMSKEEVEKVLKYLFKKTELQCNISFNMVALAGGKPLTMGLKTILKYYVNHQKDVIKRRTKRELEIAEKRFHIVQGFIRAIDIMDDIIATIRASKSKKDSIDNLVKKFQFTEIQAQAIVELMLYRLTGLEIKTFEREYRELEKTIKKLKNILEKERELLKVIKTEMKAIREKYGDERRTEIIENEEEAKIDLEDLIIVEDTVVTLSKEGYIKRIAQKTYARSNTNVEDIEYREGDCNRFLFNSNTTHTIMFFTDQGNMYQLKGISVPEYKWKEKGEKLDSIIRGLNLDKENIINVFSIENINSQKDMIFITDRGYIKKTALHKFDSNYSKIMALKMKGNEKLIFAELVDKSREEKFLKIETELNFKFTIEEPVIEESERNSLGNKLFNLSDKDSIISVHFSNEHNFSSFKVAVNSVGNIKINEKSNSNIKECNTDSESTLLFFTNRGKLLYVPAFLLQNIDKEGINIDKVNGDFEEGSEKILNVISVKDFKENIDTYFFTGNGLIKKTALEDFKTENSSTVVYKFRGDDILVNVEFMDKEKDNDIIIITLKGMGIRFSSQNISHMGRIASGVTGISLEEEDEVLKGFLCNEVYKCVEIKSKNKEKKIIPLEDFKIQNRAGRGKNIMLVLMGDYIKEIKVKRRG